MNVRSTHSGAVLTIFAPDMFVQGELLDHGRRWSAVLLPITLHVHNPTDRPMLLEGRRMATWCVRELESGKVVALGRAAIEPQLALAPHTTQALEFLADPPSTAFTASGTYVVELDHVEHAETRIYVTLEA